MALILLLRRTEDDLSAREHSALTHAFRGEALEFIRTDPTDFREHDEDCKRLNPDAVLLPIEKPIPSAAMERGVRHITVLGNELMELLPLKAEFKPFKK